MLSDLVYLCMVNVCFAVLLLEGDGGVTRAFQCRKTGMLLPFFSGTNIERIQSNEKIYYWWARCACAGRWFLRANCCSK